MSSNVPEVVLANVRLFLPGLLVKLPQFILFSDCCCLECCSCWDVSFIMDSDSQFITWFSKRVEGIGCPSLGGFSLEVSSCWASSSSPSPVLVRVPLFWSRSWISFWCRAFKSLGWGVSCLTKLTSVLESFLDGSSSSSVNLTAVPVLGLSQHIELARSSTWLVSKRLSV